MVVTLNRFDSDTKKELSFVEDFVRERGCEFALSDVWAKGGDGGQDLVDSVLKKLETEKSEFTPLYPDNMPLKEKIETVAKKIYGADSVSYSSAAEKELSHLTALGMGDLPVCLAKTQYSLSDDPKKLGRPEGFDINVREVYPSAGAGFVVAILGTMLTMPGLPKTPAAYSIDVDETTGKITGLF